MGALVEITEVLFLFYVIYALSLSDCKNGNF